MIDREKVQTITDRNPFARLLGLELLEVSEGYARGRIPMRKEFGNIYGGMHGGCVYALADTIAGIAAATYGNYVTTIDGKMNYLLPVKDTAYVYCEARTVRQGGTIGVYEARITDDGGRLLDTADFTYYRLDAGIES